MVLEIMQNGKSNVSAEELLIDKAQLMQLLARDDSSNWWDESLRYKLRWF